jgi:hypothetical protein
MKSQFDHKNPETSGGTPPNGPVVFNRKKNVDIRLSDGFITVTAHMADNYHEMAVVLDITIPGMVITDIRGRMIRIPHESCRAGLAALPGAVGLDVKKGLTLRMEKAIGGPNGCTHLTNLVMEACHASIQGQYLSLRESFGDLLDEMTPAERAKWFMTTRPQMIDSCVAYRHDAPLIEEAKKTPVTERITLLNERIAAVYQKTGGRKR